MAARTKEGNFKLMGRFKKTCGGRLGMEKKWRLILNSGSNPLMACKVKDLIIGGRFWNVENDKHTCLKIKNIPISSTNKQDILIWKCSSTGCYSTKAAYRHWNGSVQLRGQIGKA